MSFHIVADSCCELTADMKKRENIEIAPLTLEVGGESILDDETFDQKYFLKRVAECPERSARCKPGAGGERGSEDSRIQFQKRIDRRDPDRVKNRRVRGSRHEL